MIDLYADSWSGNINGCLYSCPGTFNCWYVCLCIFLFLAKTLCICFGQFTIWSSSLYMNHIFSRYFDCEKKIMTLNAHVEERKSSESFDWCFNSEFCLPEFYWISCIQNTGVFTPSDDLAKEVAAASEVSGEKLWRMPLEESYWDTMKSGVADMVNTGGRQGGAIVAALFLKQVVTLSL